MVDISKLDKAVVLAALYNNAKPQGMGFLQYDPTPMTKEEAQKLIEKTPRLYFDYVKGRVMKIDLSSTELRTALYNRDNGKEAAEQVIAGIK